MRKSNPIWKIGMCAVATIALSSIALAQSDKLNKPATIRVAPLTNTDFITPKSGASLFDSDGIGQTEGSVVVSPFTLNAIVGGDKIAVSVPEFQVEQVQWVADPIGCEDNDPKTKCQPTWGSEYSGQAGGDLPVYIEFANGAVFSPYGIANLFLNVKVVDNKIRSIDGYLQITYSAPTELPNYRVPISGKFK